MPIAIMPNSIFILLASWFLTVWQGLVSPRIILRDMGEEPVQF
jgi:hypothetical protein